VTTTSAAASATPPPAKVYTYNSDDQIETITNASGSNISNTYDIQGKIATQTITDASGNVTTNNIIYDANDNISTITNTIGTTSYQYDSKGYVSQITGANGSSISYLRDTQGRILQQTEKANAAATGIVTKYSYDIYGKLLTVTDSHNRVTTMTYDLVNRLETKTLQNGVKTTYGYDTLDQIISIVFTKADGSVMASQTYTRNLGGEPNKVLREDGSYTLYEYDLAVRLSKEVSYSSSGTVVRSIEYSYDLDGKRTKKVDNLGTHDYTYNANGQLESVALDSYTHDVDGRTSQIIRDGHSIDLTHDTFDRLTQIIKDSTTTQYLYDANGNRIREISGGNTKNYLVAPNLANGLDSTDLVTDGSGNVVSDYVYGGSEIIARLDASGNPIYYLTDDMGSVIGLVDESGNLVSRIVYDGFGNVQSGDDGSSLGGDFRFQGQWLESESGFYYMRARDYDSQTGLFLSRDPIDVQAQGVEAFSPYQFAYGNPLVYTDPTGLFTISEVNIAQSIEETLRKIQSSTLQRGIGKGVEQARKIAFDVFSSALQTLSPFSFDAREPQLFGFPLGGISFEIILQNILCRVVGESYGPIVDNIWLEPGITPQGDPRNNGYGCGGNGLNFSPSRNRGNFTRSSSYNSPDFLIKRGAPVETDRNPPAFLIGDFKRSVSAIQWYTSTGPVPQWQAIMHYARTIPFGGHQFIPVALYFSLYGEERQGQIERRKAEALRNFVLLQIISLFPKR
jgi:RHS repeat-associated protein